MHGVDLDRPRGRKADRLFHRRVGPLQSFIAWGGYGRSTRHTGHSNRSRVEQLPLRELRQKDLSMGSRCESPASSDETSGAGSTELAVKRLVGLWRIMDRTK